MFPSSMNLRSSVVQLPTQENIKCCTASATLISAEMIMKESGNPVYFSRLFLYYMTRKLQGRLGHHGAELRETLNALQKYGVCTENFWPFSHNRVEREPHQPAHDSAAHFRLLSYQEAQFNSYKEHLNNGIPIIMGMRTGVKFWKLSGPLNEQRYMPVDPANNRQSNGHAMTIVGYDDALGDGSWIVANSLGPRWGHQGYGAIPYECNVDIGESYIITNFAGITAGKKISEN